MREHWRLDPAVSHLNHGAFGACPAAVLDAQTALRAELERQPTAFMEAFLTTHVDRAREAVAPFVGARPEDVAFVTSATAGVNAVLRSLPFERGDVLLTTNHAYGACRNTLEYVASRAGAEVRVVDVPIPITDPAEVTERVLRAAGGVKLALVDHVTSPTGLVFPIADIVKGLRERGVETVVDGAHALGMLDVNVDAIGAAYYAGNFHKWVCAPKGVGMLHVRADRQAGIHPNVISNGHAATVGRSRFHAEFDWTGTSDPSACLCVPAAIACVGGLVPGGWPEVRRRNRALALEAREILSRALGASPIAPESMIGSLVSVPLPDAGYAGLATPFAEPLHAALRSVHRIEVPVAIWPRLPKRLIRVSTPLYVERREIEALASALRVELALPA